jgi:hypothetical protein
MARQQYLIFQSAHKSPVFGPKIERLTSHLPLEMILNLGCRYAHAEFSADEAAITHFDGAVRAHAWEPYLERIETSIDRAGKHADYTKVFRFDGTLAIPHWKRLLSDFFRGNKLIPEYLGAPAEMDENPEAASSSTLEPELMEPQTLFLRAARHRR